MTDFFANLPPQDALQIGELGRLAYELREDRAALLRRYGADDEIELLRRIVAAEVPEHPAYDDYLGALALGGARAEVRADLAALLQRMGS